MPKTSIISLLKGIDTTLSNDAPYDLKNLDISQRSGEAVIRSGYVPRTDTVYRTGENIAKFYYLGREGMDAYSRLFRYSNYETWVSFDERIIITSDRATPKWYDAISMTEHEMSDIEKPDPFKYVSRISQAGDNRLYGPISIASVAIDDRQTFIFTFTYTFFNDRLGLETPAADAVNVHVIIDKRSSAEGHNVRSFMLTPEVNLAAAPDWAEGVKTYVSTTDYRNASGFNEDEFFAHSYRDRNNNQRYIVEIEYLREIGVEFRHIGTHTGTTGGTTNINTFNFELLYEYDPAQARLNIGWYNEPSRYEPVPAGVAPDRLQAITLHAGRMYGYDPETRSIVFSYIDGRGDSKYDVFPLKSLEVPHSFGVKGVSQSEVTAIFRQPGGGGLYIFFRDNINVVSGQNLLTGLFSLEVSPQTDLDASQNISFGTLSPKSIVEYKSSLLFMGSDKRVYQLAGMQLTDIGKNIQGHLNTIQTDDLLSVKGAMYSDRYHLITPNRVYVFDIQYKYWTSYNWDITSIYWGKGGHANESIPYALKDDGTLVELYSGLDDDGDDIDWSITTQTFDFPKITTVSGIYIMCAPPFKEITVKIYADDDPPLTYTYTPLFSNRFLQGFYARTNRIYFELSGTGIAPIIQDIELEFSH